LLEVIPTNLRLAIWKENADNQQVKTQRLKGNVWME
jgi:hypothetical protein